jgi:transposase
MRAGRLGRIESVIALPAGTQIWIAAGVTDLRRGFVGLSAIVQTALNENPFSGHVFVFRGRRGDLIKLLWWDGAGWIGGINACTVVDAVGGHRLASAGSSRRAASIGVRKVHAIVDICDLSCPLLLALCRA